MRTIIITEQQYNDYVFGADLNEDVFISGTNDKKKTAQLTYTTSQPNTRNRGNKSSADMIKTGKMDNGNGSDTYEVPLKGGIMSYNITSINGTEVMHYFKRAFNNEKTQIKLGNVEYDLEMENSEFKQFMSTFIAKVNAVVQYRAEEFKKENKDVMFDGVSIYPVKSSSNFNIEMANRITAKHKIANLPSQQIDSSILQKDTSNLQIDDEFVNNNSEYYNSLRYKTAPQSKMGQTHMHALNTDMNKLRTYEPMKQAAEYANSFITDGNSGLNGPLITYYYRALNDERNGNQKLLMKHLQVLDKLYTEYQQAVLAIEDASEYIDSYDQTRHRQNKKSRPYQALKYTKGPSVEKRTAKIVDLLRSNGLGNNLIDRSSNAFRKFPVCMWQVNDFQIKKFANDTRMALKNYFQPNKNTELVNQEVEKTKGTIVVVFDDNVSGGATLSDICSQLQQLGMEYIIPITFGAMRQSYNIGNMVVNAPTENWC